MMRINQVLDENYIIRERLKNAVKCCNEIEKAANSATNEIEANPMARYVADISTGLNHLEAQVLIIRTKISSFQGMFREDLDDFIQ